MDRVLLSRSPPPPREGCSLWVKVECLPNYSPLQHSAPAASTPLPALTSFAFGHSQTKLLAQTGDIFAGGLFFEGASGLGCRWISDSFGLPSSLLPLSVTP